ncbi:MAG TPA: 1-acyl-sn-glycerol-3-phosphate acyltransferase [Caulobacteraceae bacterium]
MAYESSALALSSPAHPRGHIVDTLIAERAPKLAASRAWSFIKPLLYLALDYRSARRMADSIAPLSGLEALETVSRLLALEIEVRGLECVPRHGRLMVVCNHPTGIADGVAVWDVLKTVRRDTVFYANSDAHRVAAGFRDLLIPVEWMDEKRTRHGARMTLVRTREVMEAERPLVVFPAGRLARKRPGRPLRDPPWASSVFSLARKYDAPVLPLHIAGPWSSLFHLFDRFNGELRDITLFHELLNKRGRRFRILIGRPAPATTLPSDAGEAARAMKAFVEETLPPTATWRVR